jgi:hypothetical protein
VDGRQIQEAQTVDGQMPLVGPNAPFQGQTYQPLNNKVGYGVLSFVPSIDLDGAPLGPQVLLVTDLVPNDIPLTAGVITETFQTPLSHVNVLSKNRGTPNMALVDARHHPGIEPFLGKLVRLEVSAAEFEIRVATSQEAQDFWDSQQDDLPLLIPAIDTTVIELVKLSKASYGDLPAIGAKAAQLAELSDLEIDCDLPLVTPRSAFAIPVVHYLSHFEASGARALLADLSADPEFQTNPVVRQGALARVRAQIQAHPVDRALLSDVELHVAEKFGQARVRFRSSSNTEDLPQFSGAGLYLSQSGAIGDPKRPIEEAILAVWASLWNSRAYDERAYFNVSQDHVAMGILCHEAFLSERANGVAISRDLTNPVNRTRDYINVQFGEASVTNPAPGISSDMFVHRYWAGDSLDIYNAVSTFMDGVPVLDKGEIDHLHCALRQIHKHLHPIVDPLEENPWYTIEIEFKLIGDERNLMVKQARPYSFGKVEIPDECP